MQLSFTYAGCTGEALSKRILLRKPMRRPTTRAETFYAPQTKKTIAFTKFQQLIFEVPWIFPLPAIRRAHAGQASQPQTQAAPPKLNHNSDTGATENKGIT
jgi:hypothetical protein